MNPKTRSLIQLTTNNIDEIIALYDILMGNSSKERKIFITSNARLFSSVSDLIEEEGDVE